MDYQVGDIVLAQWGTRRYDDRGETGGGEGLVKIVGRPVPGRGYPVAKVDHFGDTVTGTIGYASKGDIKRKAKRIVAYRYG